MIEINAKMLVFTKSLRDFHPRKKKTKKKKQKKKNKKKKKKTYNLCYSKRPYLFDTFIRLYQVDVSLFCIIILITCKHTVKCYNFQ